jgi:tRNA (guanine-N7-)-methyltransferase
LKENGIVNFKTDDLPLFQYTRDVLNNEKINTVYYKENIYASTLDFEELEVKTFYEKQHLKNGRTINFLQFKFD